jgi:hypothetical protein
MVAGFDSDDLNAHSPGFPTAWQVHHEKLVRLA